MSPALPYGRRGIVRPRPPEIAHGGDAVAGDATSARRAGAPVPR